MEVVSIEVPEFGNRTYLVHDTRRGIVVDPPRHTAPLDRAAAALGLRVVAVAETHLHHDFVSGARALAHRHGADHLLSAGERVRFPRRPVRGGDVLNYGGLRVEVIDTPGHTFHHQSFLMSTQGRPAVLLSGGSLLHGTVGRPDLVDPASTRLLARRQWHSAREQAALAADTRLLPTHGFGDHGAAHPAALTAAPGEQAERRGLLQDEPMTNPALRLPRERFVDELLAGLGPVPRHFHRLLAANRVGVGARLPRRPRRVDEAAVHEAVRAGRWVVDVRRRERFARAHLTGTVNVEASPQLATWVGSLAPWGRPLLLVGEREEDLVGSTRDLAQVGLEVSATHLLAPGLRWQDSTDVRVVDWAGYAQAARARDITVDVRDASERSSGYLAHALHLPLHELVARVREIPPGRVWVHCRTGYRGAIAASLLARVGREVALVADDWEHAAGRDLPIRSLAEVA